MSFIHKRSTRSPSEWIIGVIATLLGVPILFIFGIADIIYSGISLKSFLALIVGFPFLAAGLFELHAIIIPKRYTRIVSDVMIVCKTNGVITHQCKKEDIKKIHLNYGENDSVDIEMKNNEILELPCDYFMGLKSFSQELMMCGYQVDEN
jgi:hypothetical protein